MLVLALRGWDAAHMGSALVLSHLAALHPWGMSPADSPAAPFLFLLLSLWLWGSSATRQTHSSCALGWSRIRGTSVCYGLSSTFFNLWICFFYSSPCYKWEDGICSPYSMCHNRLCSCYLSAKFELICFLEFGESKC